MYSVYIDLQDFEILFVVLIVIVGGWLQMLLGVR